MSAEIKSKIKREISEINNIINLEKSKYASNANTTTATPLTLTINNVNNNCTQNSVNSQIICSQTTVITQMMAREIMKKLNLILITKIYQMMKNWTSFSVKFSICPQK
jgi:hypothetical protein